MDFLQSNNIYDFDHKGKPILASADEAKQPLSYRLVRLWADPDRPFLTLSESNVSPTKVLESDAQKLPGVLNESEVKSLKETMLTKLAQADNELHLALDLVNLLVPVKVEPPELPLPPYTLSASVLSTPLPPFNPLQEAYNASTSYASKLNSLENASKALAAASERLKATTAKSAIDWQSYLSWRDAGYNLEARGAGKGATLNGKNSDRLAREVVALTVCEECQNIGLRNVGLGWLDHDDVSGKKVGFPERRAGRRRLKVKLDNGKKKMEYSSPLPEDDLEASRLEVLDEDLYDLVSVLQLSLYPC